MAYYDTNSEKWVLEPGDFGYGGTQQPPTSGTGGTGTGGTGTGTGGTGTNAQAQAFRWGGQMPGLGQWSGMPYTGQSDWRGVPFLQTDTSGHPLSNYANIVDQYQAARQPLQVGSNTFGRWSNGVTRLANGGLLGGSGGAGGGGGGTGAGGGSMDPGAGGGTGTGTGGGILGGGGGPGTNNGGSTVPPVIPPTTTPLPTPPPPVPTVDNTRKGPRGPNGALGPADFGGYQGVWSGLPAGQTPAQFAIANGVPADQLGTFLYMAGSLGGNTPSSVIDHYLNPHSYMTPAQIAAEQANAAQWGTYPGGLLPPASKGP